MIHQSNLIRSKTSKDVNEYIENNCDPEYFKTEKNSENQTSQSNKDELMWVIHYFMNHNTYKVLKKSILKFIYGRLFVFERLHKESAFRKWTLGRRFHEFLAWLTHTGIKFPNGFSGMKISSSKGCRPGEGKIFFPAHSEILYFKVNF